MPRLSDPWWLHPSSTGIFSSNFLFMDIWDVGNGCYRTHHPSKIQRTSLHLGHNYFSKWTEAIPLKEVKTSDVIKFIKHHVLYHFGVPRQLSMIIPQFVSKPFQRFCNKFRIQSVSSTAYYPAAKGLAEVFNKAIGKLLKKFVSKSQRDWDNKLGDAYGLIAQQWEPRWKLHHSLWYIGWDRTSIRNSDFISTCCLDNRDDE